MNINNAYPDIALESNFKRTRSLVRPSRQKTRKLISNKKEGRKYSAWCLFAYCVTFWAPPFLLRLCGKKDKAAQIGFREKIALCVVIMILCCAVAFLTFGMQVVLCPPSDNSASRLLYDEFKHSNEQTVSIDGMMYPLWIIAKQFKGLNLRDKQDFTLMFPPDPQLCANVMVNGNIKFPCNPCFDRNLLPFSQGTVLYFDWADLQGQPFIVFNGEVMDMSFYIKQNQSVFGAEADRIIMNKLGYDATASLKRLDQSGQLAKCLSSLFKIGQVDKETRGCFAANLILTLSLIVIVSVILVRFIMAIAFDWFISHQLDKLKDERNKRRRVSAFIPKMSRFSVAKGALSRIVMQEQDVFEDPFVVLLITCYSEGEESLRSTIDSLASTDYPDDRKLLLIVADGLITGSGNNQTTPEIVLGMIELDSTWDDPQPMSYMAVASGSKQHNMAKVYVGYYSTKNHTVPVIVIVKCGTPLEIGQPKPGNRGKRDSQLILMNFFQRVLFDDRMCPLDFDLFTKINYLFDVSADKFEIVLMVDADTRVLPDSLTRMVSAMKRDPFVMGLCGETRIHNKRQSWVTAIQVFEYYISHHLGKAFESVFGGVTCLPGCFCMYRIKAPKNGLWVPILANPEIIEEYSKNKVETLHQKNLLLLGEDRFLTTLMLKTFPKRKLIFVPKATCKTVVPDEFRVLLSQRRRWINSTIHNLLELVLVRELCGTFCFSMQFVIFLELVGTVVLPAAITFTVVLIVSSATSPNVEWIPLALLAAVLGLPAVLILLTTRKLVYISWMLVYLLALPIWNFVLPVYAYWHFDDVSWGETRKVQGESKDTHGKKEGAFEHGKVQWKKWSEWNRLVMNYLRSNTSTQENDRTY